jgi:hypothetical protein
MLIVKTKDIGTELHRNGILKRFIIPSLWDPVAGACKFAINISLLCSFNTIAKCYV